MNFAPAFDTPIAYMQRTRQWYLALGYSNPYVWAHYDEVPFQPLGKPLSRATLGLITTASLFQADKGPQGPGAPYNAAAKFYQVYSKSILGSFPDVRISHVNIDRKHTSMEDAAAWFPLRALQQQAAEGRIAAVAGRFYGMPTNRSQRHTLEVDAPELLQRCLEDGIDAAILVANCPVCHQTLSLAARYLEAHGIATVIMGCAKDVVEYCGVPRFLFSDFPLGNAAGKPHDVASQQTTLALALRLLENAPAARTTVQNPLRWSENAQWKNDYCNAESKTAEELARFRLENDKSNEIARKLREALNIE